MKKLKFSVIQKVAENQFSINSKGVDWGFSLSLGSPTLPPINKKAH